MDPKENVTPENESPEVPGVDMTGWSEEDKLAYIAAKQEADDAEQEAAELAETPAQIAIAAEKARAERARAEAKRAKREKVESEVVKKLRAQFGKKITFFQSKEGLIAARHPSVNHSLEWQTRINNLSRPAEKLATAHDSTRELIEYPSKDRVKEIEKLYPMILTEVDQQITSEQTARDYTARPID